MPSPQKSLPLGVFLLLGFHASLMLGVIFVDYEWTLYLIENRWAGFAEVMRRTIFEGDALGASDPAIFYILLAFALYVWSSSRKAPAWLLAWRCVLGFVVFAALSSGLGFIHSIKWALGRVRPHLLLSENLPYSAWYEFGAHYVADGVFFGSFPSGHTAVIALFLTLAYALAGDPLLEKKWRFLGWLWGGMAFASSVFMLVGRSMAKAHWLSDGLASVAMIWIFSHLLYHHILKVPQQRLYFQLHQHYPNFSRFWEMRLCGYFLLVALGGMGLLMGVNAFQRQSPPWLGVLLVLGLPMSVGFAWKARAYYQGCMEKWQAATSHEVIVSETQNNET